MFGQNNNKLGLKIDTSTSFQPQGGLGLGLVGGGGGGFQGLGGGGFNAPTNAASRQRSGLVGNPPAAVNNFALGLGGGAKAANPFLGGGQPLAQPKSAFPATGGMFSQQKPAAGFGAGGGFGGGGFGGGGGGAFGVGNQQVANQGPPSITKPANHIDFEKIRIIYFDYIKKFEFHTYERDPAVAREQNGYMETEDEENPNSDQYIKVDHLLNPQADPEGIAKGLVVLINTFQDKLKENKEKMVTWTTNFDFMKVELGKLEELYIKKDLNLENLKQRQVTLKLKCLKLMKQLIVHNNFSQLDYKEEEFKERVNIIRSRIKEPQFGTEELKSSFRAASTRKSKKSNSSRHNELDEFLRDALQILDIQSDELGEKAKVLLKNKSDLIRMREALKLK